MAEACFREEKLFTTAMDEEANLYRGLDARNATAQFQYDFVERVKRAFSESFGELSWLLPLVGKALSIPPKAAA